MGLIWFRSFGRPYTGPQRDVGSNPTGSTIFYGPQHVQNCSHTFLVRGCVAVDVHLT